MRWRRHSFPPSLAWTFAYLYISAQPYMLAARILFFIGKRQSVVILNVVLDSPGVGRPGYEVTQHPSWSILAGFDPHTSTLKPRHVSSSPVLAGDCLLSKNRQPEVLHHLVCHLVLHHFPPWAHLSEFSALYGQQKFHNGAVPAIPFSFEVLDHMKAQNAGRKVL